MEVTTAAEDEEVFRLVYRSRDLIPPEQRRAELGRLFTQARSNNKQQHITGALLVEGDWFVQTLEGEEEAVRSLYEHIATDPRHEGVALLQARPVQQRVFARWAMAMVAADGEPDIPVIAHTDGLARAARRGDATPEQEAVLSFMREAPKGAAMVS